MIDVLVIKRDGSDELFDVSKVSESIMGAAMSVGGEDMDLAEDLAYKVKSQGHVYECHSSYVPLPHQDLLSTPN